MTEGPQIVGVLPLPQHASFLRISYITTNVGLLRIGAYGFSVTSFSLGKKLMPYSAIPPPAAATSSSLVSYDLYIAQTSRKFKGRGYEL